MTVSTEPDHVPIATYRLQLRAGQFTLDDAANLVPYVDALGIEVLTRHLESCVLGHGTHSEHAKAKPMTKEQLVADLQTVLSRFLK